jgi:3-isopropylmalate dehydrogenase
MNARGMGRFETEEGLVGGSCYDAHKVAITDETMAKAHAADAVIFGAVGGPKWDSVPYDVRPEAGLLRLRKDLGLFANIRPAICYPALADASSLKREVVDGLDIIILRELTGGVYFGEPKTITDLGNGQKRAIDTQVYDTYEIERITRVAFELAKKRRNKVTSMEKRNVMKTGVLWHEVVNQLHAREFKDVALEHQLADAGGMQLVRWPKQFDVIVTDNLFGDMLSDVAAMLTGSLGMLPSASLGELDPKTKKRKAMYEPVHGSAPDIAGKGIANPIAMLASFAMALRYSFDMGKEDRDDVGDGRRGHRRDRQTGGMTSLRGQAGVRTGAMIQWRRSGLALWLSALAMVMAVDVAGAQTDSYPGRPVRLIVPFAAGGLNDVVARLVAPYLERALGQPFIIDNRPAASGIVGTDATAKATPDGYTLLMVASSFTVIPATHQKVPYDAQRDLAPIVMVAKNALLFLVNPKVPAKSLAEFVALAKADPGKFNYASPGAATQTHLVVELFSQRAGIKLQHIPYRGGAPAMTAMVAGDTQFTAISTLLSLPQIQSAALRAIASGSLTRDPQLPDLPTVAEQGFPGFEAIQWIGLLTTAGTPAEIIERLNAEVNRALRDPDLIAKFAQQGISPAGGTPADFQRTIATDLRNWTETARAANIKAE